MSDGVPVMWMRGGTSKGGYFLAKDLPENTEARDIMLLRLMGSPDPRQINGMGGGNPLTSKVAIVSKSKRPRVDVDYLFLQVGVDQALVSDTQNCGNILAGVGPFAIERGLVAARDGTTLVTVYMENTGRTATLEVSTPASKVTYAGSAAIDGVPGTSAAIAVEFQDTAGSMCGSLLPTGKPKDRVHDLDVTLIDSGMPCVIIRAAEMGLTGQETPAELEANKDLKRRLEALRLAVGPMMNLGNVADKSVPKMTLISEPQRGGLITTRTFIPHRCHKAIGVLGAVSVATACLMPGTVATGIAQPRLGPHQHVSVEHPSGAMTVVATLGPDGRVTKSAILRTARKLMDGVIFP